LTLPDPSKKIKYPSINLSPLNNILSSNGRSFLGSEAIKAGGRLLTFEELDQFSGFVLYESTLPAQFSRDPAELTVEKLRDRALIYVDGKLAGVLSRENGIKSFPLNKGSAGKKLQILVENQGRINFQENFDFKGILGNVTLQIFDEPYYEEISDWTITGYPFEDFSQIENFIASEAGSNYELPKNGWLKEGPVLFHGTLNIDNTEEVADTWWHVKGWGKGSLFVNGFNLGRYWSIGPQMTMYIPKEHLQFGDNSIVILELQKAPIDLQFNFSDFADFNEE
jgi:beta-galactosidase